MKRLDAAMLMIMILVPFSVLAQEVVIGDRPQRGPEYFVPDPENIQIEVWSQDLKAPWSLVFLPDGRALVSERQGTIRLLSQNGDYDEAPLLNMDVAEDDESGLMGLALDPNFPKAPFVYAMRTFRQGKTWNNEVLRLLFDGHNLSLDKKLIANIPAGNNHNGGRIGFGPDGMLYVGTGDIFERRLAQDLKSLAGKILRLTPEGFVPSDNPFPRSYVWSWGHRNVQGLAWDPDTGALYNTEHGPSGEVGFGAFDEVNVVVKGGNFGWPRVVGAAGEAGLVDPIV
ncbi:MAG: PQQ-dependent sugar dehydrogenase, partial [Magnetovibrio sp.]|nr:PQQ-dependent sugar dehydrogenase [Magnetovibrio sp.]